MRLLIFAAVVFASIAGAVLPVFESVPTASACSCSDCDSVRDSDLIVGGWVEGWRAVDDPKPTDSDSPISLDLRIDAVYKGLAPQVLQLQDPRSLSSHLNNGALMWMGGSGGCQAFYADPSGKYLVVGLATSGPDAYQGFGPKVFFIGDEAAGEHFDFAQGRFTALGAPRPPSVGDSPPPEPESSNDWMFLSAIGAGAILITLVLLLGGPRREKRHDHQSLSGRDRGAD